MGLSYRDDVYSKKKRLFQSKKVVSKAKVPSTDNVATTPVLKTILQVFHLEGVCGGLMISVLQIKWSGFELGPGTLCRVLGQDTLLSKCLPSNV